MCKHCLEHGEGQKWFLNFKHFSEEQLDDKARKAIVEMYIWKNITQKGLPTLSYATLRYGFHFALMDTLIKVPEARALVKKSINQFMARYHFGQVLSPEETEAVLELSSHLCVFPCPCRRKVQGKKEYSCLGVAAFAQEVDKGPNPGGAKALSHEEARALIHDYQEKGCLQSLWTLKTPFLATLCNCDALLCQGIKKRFEAGIEEVFLPGHSWAETVAEKCTGCMQCLEACPFKARQIKDNTVAATSLQACFGCGLCLKACPQGAIELNQRP